VKQVKQKLDECQFCRVEQPPDSPDLAPCDLFLFGYLDDTTLFLSYGIVNELQEAMPNTTDTIPKAKFVQVIQTCRWRSERCIQQEGHHFEETESDAANSLSLSSWDVGQSGHLMDTL
jgi:hypothetical protein